MKQQILESLNMPNNWYSFSQLKFRFFIDLKFKYTNKIKSMTVHRCIKTPTRDAKPKLDNWKESFKKAKFEIFNELNAGRDVLIW